MVRPNFSIFCQSPPCRTNCTKLYHFSIFPYVLNGIIPLLQLAVYFSHKLLSSIQCFAFCKATVTGIISLVSLFCLKARLILKVSVVWTVMEELQLEKDRRKKEGKESAWGQSRKKWRVLTVRACCGRNRTHAVISKLLSSLSVLFKWFTWMSC